MSQRIPLAWRQLAFERMKLFTAMAGVMVAVMLMWVQLGILAAVYASATEFHRHIQADLVVFHPLSENMTKMKPLSTRTLYRLRGHPDVSEIGELFTAMVDWRVPETGEVRPLMAYGLDPEGGWLSLPGIAQHAAELRSEDTLLFDRKSKAVFGGAIAAVERGEPFEVEINHRRARVVGLTEIGSTFGQEGGIVTSRANFLRMNPNHPPAEVHLGLIRLRPGADVKAVQAYYQRELAPEALVLTPAEFKDFELRFWQTRAPVGFVFTMGTVAGFFIGFIVVYQILYTDVSNHLPQFATMKAMGFTDFYLLKVVLRQAALLSVLGYVPGTILAIGFYRVMEAGTSIPVKENWERAGFLFALTCIMCLLSGAMATRRLRAADPADVF
jgi:putative ABC transport system permease protein